ncbi:MAG: hypothetical protein GXP41_10015 [Chloroflexi bacterium]|nr:hypothetical protein [Chloroflexota bacterium]
MKMRNALPNSRALLRAMPLLVAFLIAGGLYSIGPQAWAAKNTHPLRQTVPSPTREVTSTSKPNPTATESGGESATPVPQNPTETSAPAPSSVPANATETPATSRTGVPSATVAPAGASATQTVSTVPGTTAPGSPPMTLSPAGGTQPLPGQTPPATLPAYVPPATSTPSLPVRSTAVPGSTQSPPADETTGNLTLPLIWLLAGLLLAGIGVRVLYSRTR